MKRMHTAEQYRADHHERATFAVKFTRMVRKVVKPARLYWIAMQEQNADEHISDLVAISEAIPKDIVRMHRESVRLKAKRMAIERGVA